MGEFMQKKTAKIKKLNIIFLFVLFSKHRSVCDLKGVKKKEKTFKVKRNFSGKNMMNKRKLYSF